MCGYVCVCMSVVMSVCISVLMSVVMSLVMSVVMSVCIFNLDMNLRCLFVSVSNFRIHFELNYAY